jgi:hypothetical protein
VSITTNDINNQGYDDIVLGSPAGLPPEVKVLDGKTFDTVEDFSVFTPSFLNGVFVG